MELLSRNIQRAISTYQILNIYLDLLVHDCKKWAGPNFGCKLGPNDPIMMNLKLDKSCHLLNVYTKFENDISKHVEKESWKLWPTSVLHISKVSGEARRTAFCSEILM